MKSVKHYKIFLKCLQQRYSKLDDVVIIMVVDDGCRQIVGFGWLSR